MDGRQRERNRDTLEPIPSFQHTREQAELTEAQRTYVDQFAQTRIAAQLSTTPLDETEVENRLRLAYQVVGLAPPQIRWFDSPLAFLLAPESPPQSIELLLRTSVEARVAAIIAERLSLPVWDELSFMLDVIGDSVWNAVGRLIQDALLERVGRTTPDKGSVVPRVLTRYDLQHTLWSAAEASLWPNTYYRSSSYILTSQRIEDSIQAYTNQAWLAFPTFFAGVWEPHDLLHLARFNELVSGYCLGRAEAWLVRKPTQIARDQQGLLHAEDGPCLRYPDGWGFYAWHGARVPEQLILHPEQVTPEDWLHQKDENVRRAIQERIGHRRFAEMVGGCRVEHGALVVDVGQGPERTGYVVHMQGDTPRVCRFPRVFFESQCQPTCPQHRPCPRFSDVHLWD